VYREIMSERTYSVIYQTLGHLPSSRDPAEGQARVQLSKIVSLATITLLSVGLWAAIWAAANSVAAVWLR
jgi:hypothetical protein